MMLPHIATSGSQRAPVPMRGCRARAGRFAASSRWRIAAPQLDTLPLCYRLNKSVRDNPVPVPEPLPCIDALDPVVDAVVTQRCFCVKPTRRQLHGATP